MTHDGVVADCQRMVWDGRRWLIGPGAVPAQTPVQPEPGTRAAYRAGFRDLVVADGADASWGQRRLPEQSGGQAGETP